MYKHINVHPTQTPTILLIFLFVFQVVAALPGALLLFTSAILMMATKMAHIAVAVIFLCSCLFFPAEGEIVGHAAASVGVVRCTAGEFKYTENFSLALDDIFLPSRIIHQFRDLNSSEECRNLCCDFGKSCNYIIVVSLNQVNINSCRNRHIIFLLHLSSHEYSKTMTRSIEGPILVWGLRVLLKVPLEQYPSQMLLRRDVDLAALVLECMLIKKIIKKLCEKCTIFRYSVLLT